jgi:hypothetical protein
MKRYLSLLWPPYGLYLAKQTIRTRDADPWARALEELKIDFPSQDDKESADAVLADAEKLASSVLEAEIKRKDVLESKAATFVVTPAVATAITAAIVPLKRDLGMSDQAATFVTICYAIALIHLLVSSWYAITARRAESFIALSALNAHSLMSSSRTERIVARLAYARLNEPALLMKSNRLSVSEDMFLRGLAFLAVAACFTLIAHVVSL